MYARMGLSGLFLWGFWFLLSLSLRLFHTIPLSGFGSGGLSSGWYSLLLIPTILFFWLGPCESEIRFLFAGQDYFERKDALALRYIGAGNYYAEFMHAAMAWLCFCDDEEADLAGWLLVI